MPDKMDVIEVLSLRSGDIVEHPRWSEPLQVVRIETVDDGYVRIVGVLLVSRRHEDCLLTLQDAVLLTPTRLSKPFSAPPVDVFLALESKRYRYASLYDPLLAMNISKVDPLPHQIEAVYGYVLHRPQIRFLIADDPGAGKTIMAGLVIKELKLRSLMRRVLIVTPGHLKDQWQREMKERFEENFILVDRNTMRSYFGENIWQREFQVITSLDFARQEDVMQTLSGVHWDLIIVDEAHKMAAYRYGEKIEKTKRYRLGEILSKTSSHLLFLTATPHRGDPENFRLFLDLLQPGVFATSEMLQQSINDGDNPLFIRRMKEDLKDFEGKPLFLPRHVRTITFNMGVESKAEKQLYNELSRYVEQQYNKALAKERRRNIAFAMVILQRRLASSIYALAKSLERRKERLEEMLYKVETFQQGSVLNETSSFSWEEVEELSEEERWQQEALWETLSVAENRAELNAEIQTIQHLLEQARSILRSGEEIKLKRIKEALQMLQQQEPGEKVLVFTESRDTLEYLERRLREWGYSVCKIHGGMNLDERIKAEAIFRNQAQLMVATEAAGEGINLQFCHLMINYDLPWNPNRLEQRMGRIHRYGQTREVFIFNLVAVDTREGQVMKCIFDKLETIRQQLQTDKVFDVIDELFPGRDLARLMVEAAANARTMEEILKEVDIRVDEEYFRNIKIVLGESLATRFMDYTRIREMAEQAREHRLIPEYTQAFFQRAWQRLGGEMRLRKDGGQQKLFIIERMPREIRQIAEAEDFKKRFGSLLTRYPRVTFDKDVAKQDATIEFVSFGHPLFEAVLHWAEHNLAAGLRQGAVFTDPDGRMDGTLMFFEGGINDGTGQIAGKRLFALFIPGDGSAGWLLPPSMLWDLQEGGELPPSSTDLAALQEQALRLLIPQLEAYRHELIQERQRQAEIKRKYGIESLRYLILKLDGELINLYQHQQNGETVEVAIREKERRKADYEQAKKELEERLTREVQLTLATPVFLAGLRIVPRKMTPLMTADEMASSAELEWIGMQLALEYEKRQGRHPEDVSAQNLGFDIRSTDPQTGEKRYIEVKARAGVGKVALTPNEWFKAQRFGGQYYLYVVFNAASQPQLHIVPDPANRLPVAQTVEVRYLISAEAILSEAR